MIHVRMGEIHIQILAITSACKLTAKWAEACTSINHNRSVTTANF
jgi:hypothetical protein